MSESERGKKELLHSVCLQKQQTGFDISEEKFPLRPVGSNLFCTYKETEPFPCPALVLQQREFPRERDGMKRGARGKGVKGYEGRKEARKEEKGREEEGERARGEGK